MQFATKVNSKSEFNKLSKFLAKVGPRPLANSLKVHIDESFYIYIYIHNNWDWGWGFTYNSKYNPEYELVPIDYILNLLNTNPEYFI